MAWRLGGGGDFPDGLLDLGADLFRPVLYRRFLAAAPAGEPEHGPAEEVRGNRGPVRLTEVSAGDGTANQATATWTLVRCDGEARPVLRSLVADGAETWVIDDVTPDPASGLVSTCECTLAK